VQKLGRRTAVNNSLEALRKRNFCLSLQGSTLQLNVFARLKTLACEGSRNLWENFKNRGWGGSGPHLEGSSQRGKAPRLVGVKFSPSVLPAQTPLKPHGPVLQKRTRPPRDSLNPDHIPSIGICWAHGTDLGEHTPGNETVPP